MNSNIQGALLALVALTASSAVLYVLPGGFLFRLILSAAVYAYAVVILRATANGHLDAPAAASRTRCATASTWVARCCWRR